MERIGNFFLKVKKCLYHIYELKKKTKNYVESLQSASNLSLSLYIYKYLCKGLRNSKLRGVSIGISGVMGRATCHRFFGRWDKATDIMRNVV